MTTLSEKETIEAATADLEKVMEQSDGSAVVGDDPTTAPNDDDGQDERPVQQADGDDEEHGDDNESAEDADARRERNRKRRTENKGRRKDYVDSLKRELAARDNIINDLSTRITSVERQSQGSQMVQLDSAIKEAADYYNHFKNINKQAIEAVDGSLAVDAQEKMFAAAERHKMLLNAKKNMVSQTQRPQPLDPRLKGYAEDWMSKNDWYDPSGTDMDSDLVLKIDQRLVDEGWNPITEDYWNELDARVQKYLPHRKNRGYNGSQQDGEPKRSPRVPVAGSGRDDSGGTPKGTYQLSRERVQALRDAGVWEDPVKRADAIKRYKQHDAQQASNK